MTLLFAIVLVLHGLIHLLGVAKAFGLADLPQLTQPISPSQGALWLLAALLFLAAAAALYAWPRGWWAIGAAGIVVSMLVVVPSWADAKAGAVVNAVVLAGVVFGYLAHGPGSLLAAYEREVARGLSRGATPPPLTDAELAPLPVPVQRYIRASGAVGQPRVHNYRVRMHGRIRSGPDARWMPFTAEQHSFTADVGRLFYLNASMMFLPVQGLHQYVGDTALMRVKAAGLVTVADLAGYDMTRAETVTLFNDLCIMAPGALIDPAITWEPIDSTRVAATYTNAGHTIRAELWFDEAGALTNFISDDRLAASADGRTMTPMRWSTPLSDYRAFGLHRLASRGEGRWHAPDGEYVYLDLVLDDIAYNVGPHTTLRQPRP
jgi:hypothetical protein